MARKPRNRFQGKSYDWVLQKYNEVLESQANGGTITASESGVTKASMNRVESSLADRKDALLETLKFHDPTGWTWPTRITKTHARYYWRHHG